MLKIGKWHVQQYQWQLPLHYFMQFNTWKKPLKMLGSLCVMDTPHPKKRENYTENTIKLMEKHCTRRNVYHQSNMHKMCEKKVEKMQYTSYFWLLLIFILYCIFCIICVLFCKNLFIFWKLYFFYLQMRTFCAPSRHLCITRKSWILNVYFCFNVLLSSLK